MKIIRKCFSMSGFIRRQTSEFTDTHSIILLYNSLVRSSLEYCCTIWSPYYEVHINRLERIQRKICNYILFKLNINKNDYNYNERLDLLGFKSLRYRRTCNYIKFAHKLFNGKIDCSELISLLSLRIPNYGTRLTTVLHATYHRTNYGFHSPINNIVNCINNLPYDFDIFSASWTQLMHLIRSNMQ